MKYSILIATSALLFSCSTETPPTLEDRIDDALTKYYKNLPDLGSDKIDSVEVLSIDSISQKEAFEFKLNYYAQAFKEQKEVYQNREDIYTLGETLYSDDLQKMNRENADKELAKMNSIADKHNDLFEQMKSMDSTSFKYYLPTFKVYGTSKGSFMQLELQQIMTKNLVVVLPENL